MDNVNVLNKNNQITTNIWLRKTHIITNEVNEKYVDIIMATKDDILTLWQLHNGFLQWYLRSHYNDSLGI